MENSPQQRKGFPIVETVIGVACIWILIALIRPSIGDDPPSGKSKMATALSNGRQIHQAAYRMALDNAAKPDPELGWPGDLAQAGVNPISLGSQYVERLVEYKYLDRGTLAKLFGGPGVTPYSGSGRFEGKNSVYHFYKIKDSDLDEALFLATKNYTFASALDEHKPFGNKGAVIVRKGGDAQMLSAGGATQRNVGVMPGGTIENPGEQTGNILPD